MTIASEPQSEDTPRTVDELINFLRDLTDLVPNLANAKISYDLSNLNADGVIRDFAFDHGNNTLRMISRWS